MNFFYEVNFISCHSKEIFFLNKSNHNFLNNLIEIYQNVSKLIKNKKISMIWKKKSLKKIV